MRKCPICDVEAKARAENASFPFCSARCKMVDLGKWLNEEYRVPLREEELDEDELDAALKDGLSKTDEDMRH